MSYYPQKNRFKSMNRNDELVGKKKDKKRQMNPDKKPVDALYKTASCDTVTVYPNRLRIAELDIDFLHSLSNSPKYQTANNNNWMNNSPKTDGSSITSRGMFSTRSTVHIGGNSSTSNQENSIHQLSYRSPRITTREIIQGLKHNLELNKTSPRHVAPLKSLSSDRISWNSKFPKNNNPENPQINIIGCLHPIELILAKADQRLRHQTEAIKISKQICETRQKELNDQIQMKYTRAERHLEEIHHRQRQSAFLKILGITSYFNELQKKFLANKLFHLKTIAYLSMAIRIQQAFLRWFQRHIFRKYTIKIFRIVKNKSFQILMLIRLYRKRCAIKKIKLFLTDHLKSHMMNVIVHRFVRSVRKIQRVIRDFLACKTAKLYVLSIIWEKYESEYISHQLTKRQERKDKVKEQMKSGSKKFDFDEKTRIEMKAREAMWQKIDTMVERNIGLLKQRGVIVELSLTDSIRQMLIPLPIRMKYVHQLLEYLRTEFHLGRNLHINKMKEVTSSFTEADAKDLLFGSSEKLTKIISHKFTKDIMATKYEPFSLFRSIKSKLFMDKIREAHRFQLTFSRPQRDTDDTLRSHVSSYANGSVPSALTMPTYSSDHSIGSKW